MYIKNLMKWVSRRRRKLFGFLIAGIIPVIFLLNGLHYLNNCGPRSTLNYDPEYIYLYSGISLGRLELNVGHIDNPGTPLQVLYAVVTRVTHFFAGKGDYYSDVLLRSDFYLKRVDYTKISLISSFLLLFGILFFKVSGSIFSAILLQLSPFLNLHSLQVFERIVPESLSLIPVLFIFYLTLKFLYSNKEKLTNRDIWYFALLAGFGVSIKLDYLPLVLIPAFILGNWKNHALYFGRFLVSFFVFAFPILFDLRFFFEWIKKLFIHSGRYGSGASNIIDWPQFWINLDSLYSLYPVYIIIVGMLIITLATSFFFKNKDRKMLAVIKGLVLCSILHILLVGKHFSVHYIIPSVFLFPLSLYCIFNTLMPGDLLKKASFFIIAVFFIGATTQKYKKMMLWKVPAQNEKRHIIEETRTIVGDAPFLIIPFPYSGYFEESGLLFGWFFSGHLRVSASEILTRELPNRYVYDNINDAFFLWSKSVPIEEIAETNNRFYVFINKGVQERHANVLERFRLKMQEDCVYTNGITGDKLYYYYKD